MDSEDREIASRHSEALRPRPIGTGRLGTYTALGAVTGVVPLPFIPDAMVRRVRGALVHDLASRHGLSLTPEARAVLVDNAAAEGPRGYVSQGIAFAVTRVLGRIGPLALLPPVRTALGTYVLGHLFARYLETARTSRSVRVDLDEARRVRRAIDQAFVYALTTEGGAPREDALHAPEDLRGQGTAVVDGVLISIASLPGWLVRRLDAAFDDVLGSVRA